MDGAISRAGGEALYKARKALPVLEHLPNWKISELTGDAKITIGGELNASHPCCWPRLQCQMSLASLKLTVTRYSDLHTPTAWRLPMKD